MKRARAPAAAAPTRPAGWGAWMRIGFAARAFRHLFRWLFAKTKLVSAFVKTLSVSQNTNFKLSSTALPLVIHLKACAGGVHANICKIFILPLEWEEQVIHGKKDQLWAGRVKFGHPTG